MPPAKKKKTTAAPADPIIIEATAEKTPEPEPAPAPCPAADLVRQSDLQGVQEGVQVEIDRIDGDMVMLAQAMKDALAIMNKELHPKQKPWYSSAGVWLAILLTATALYLAYVFYLSETGHSVTVPGWFLDWLGAAIPR